MAHKPSDEHQQALVDAHVSSDLKEDAGSRNHREAERPPREDGGVGKARERRLKAGASARVVVAW